LSITTYIFWIAQLVNQQNYISLSDCLYLAEVRDPTLKSINNQVLITNNTINIQKATILPTLSFSASGTKQAQDDATSAYYGYDLSKSYSLGLDMNVPLYTGGANQADLAKTRISWELAKIHYDQATSELQKNVRNAFWQYLAERSRVEVDSASLIRAEEDLSRAEDIYDLGQASRAELVKVKARVTAGKLKLHQSQLSFQQARINLAKMIGKDTDSNWEIADPEMPLPNAISFNDALNTAFKKRWEITEIKNNRESAKLDYIKARSYVLPKLSLTGSYSWYDINPPWDTKNWSENDNWSLSFLIRQSLFDGLASKYAISNAKLNITSIDLDEQIYNDLITTQVKTAHRQLISCLDDNLLAEENVELSQEALNLTREAWLLGAATEIEVKDAELSLSEAQYSLINAKYQAFIAMSNLYYVMGISEN
jgi:outer membrane protein